MPLMPRSLIENCEVNMDANENLVRSTYPSPRMRLPSVTTVISTFASGHFDRYSNYSARIEMIRISIEQEVTNKLDA